MDDLFSIAPAYGGTSDKNTITKITTSTFYVKNNILYTNIDELNKTYFV